MAPIDEGVNRWGHGSPKNWNKESSCRDGRLRPRSVITPPATLTKSDRLLLSAGESISLRQGGDRSLVDDNCRAEPLHMQRYVKTWRHPQNRKSVSRQRTGNTYRKFREIWTRGIWDMRADRQTDKHTDTLITVLGQLTRCKVNMGCATGLWAMLTTSVYKL